MSQHVLGSSGVMFSRKTWPHWPHKRRRTCEGVGTVRTTDGSLGKGGSGSHHRRRPCERWERSVPPTTALGMVGAVRTTDDFGKGGSGFVPSTTALGKVEAVRTTNDCLGKGGIGPHHRRRPWKGVSKSHSR